MKKLKISRVIEYLAVSFTCLLGLSFTTAVAQPIGDHYDDPITLLPPESEDWGFTPSLEALDINGDGKDDVVLAAWKVFDGPAPLFIWISNDSGTMDDRTEELIVGDIPIGGAGYRQIIPADFNGDGHIDLFLEGHGAEPDCGDGSTQCHPGDQSGLLLSDDNGHLVNVTSTNLPQIIAKAHGSTVADFDGDGDIDIWVNTIGNSPLQDVDFCYLLFNDGDGVFTVVADNSPPWYENRIIGPNGYLPDIFWVAGFWSDAIDTNGDGQMDLAIASDYLGKPEEIEITGATKQGSDQRNRFKIKQLTL